MSAFIPATGLQAISGTRVGSSNSVTPVFSKTKHVTPSRQYPRMIAYPYTGSGYGAAGVPYGGDRFGQSFKQTTTEDIVQTAASVPIFSTLVSLLQETGLDYELAKGGPFTVFAPTNDAFASLLEPHGFTVLAPLLRPENREELKKVLSYHVIKGEISSGAVVAAGQLTGETLAGPSLTVMGYGKKVSAATGRVVKADIPCTNGVIHVISSILLPPNYEQQPAGPVEPKFIDSQIQDVYGKMLTPRQALGIDPLPASADSSAITK